MEEIGGSASDHGRDVELDRAAGATRHDGEVGEAIGLVAEGRRR